MLLDTSIVSTAIPRITSDFHSLNDVGWYGTAYLVANCAVQPLSGKMYTHFNSKWTFITFFTIFELGSAICGAAQSSNMLIVGRALAGIGSSGLMNGAFTILNACVPPARRDALTGILMGLSQLGLLSGPLIGGALTQHASWRWCFYINLPCAALIYPGLILVPIPEARTTQQKSLSLCTALISLDIPGFALFAGTVMQLLFALNWGGTSHPWNSSTIIGLFVGCGVTFLVFIIWEYRVGDQAMIPLSLVRQRIIWASCANYAFLFGSMMCATYYLPMYFQAVRGASPTMSGVDLLPTIVPTMLFAGICGVLVTKIGYYLPFALLSGTIVTIGSALLTTLTPTTASRNWIGYQIISGIGRGMGVQMPLLAVQTVASRSQHSIATGLVVLSQNLGGAVFLAVCQVVFSSGLSSELGRYAPGVDARTLEAAGAGAVRSVVGSDEELLRGVLRAYNGAVGRVLVVAAAAAGAAVLAAGGMGWVSVIARRGKEDEGGAGRVAEVGEAGEVGDRKEGV
ncbi:MDR family MFS transporter [Aspergillus stella-maris]|uniref:MDR family MFS transporter n=1 Tax=Aspergillus stella-maris TaxID=1810926 RepID=UPI003CCCE6A0